MPRVEIQDAAASCGHLNTGSNNVFVNGKGITRVSKDSAGAQIIGPGSQTVFTDDPPFRVSLEGDAIVGHGKSPHASPFTENPSPNVYAGTGFLPPHGMGPVESPNLITTSITPGSINLGLSGLNYYPPNPSDALAIKNYCNPTGPVNNSLPTAIEISYTIKNIGEYDSGSFTVGHYKLPTAVEDTEYKGSAYILVENLDPQFYEENHLALLSTAGVSNLSPGEEYTGTFTLPKMFLNQQTYYFAVYSDIYSVVTEPDENNSFKSIEVKLDNSCATT